MSEAIVFLNVFVVELITKFNMNVSNEAMLNLVLLFILIGFMSVIYGTIMAFLSLTEKIGEKRFKKYNVQRFNLDKLS